MYVIAKGWETRLSQLHSCMVVCGYCMEWLL